MPPLERRITEALSQLTLRKAVGLIVGMAATLSFVAAVILRLIDPGIGTFGDALWWAVSTVSTVGYGDVLPQTGAGRAVAAALMLVGLGLIPLITSVVVSILVSQRTREAREEEMRDLAVILERLDCDRPQARADRAARARTAASPAEARPVGRHVGAALLGDPRAEADEGGVGHELAREERLALAEARSRARAASAGRTRARRRRTEVGGRVHAHEHEVVALREHVLVHLLRPLRGHEEVEAELAALGRDADGVVGGQRRDEVVRAAADRCCAPRR